MSSGNAYSERVTQQIAQYAETIDMHDLPPIFHVWSYNYIRPAMLEVFGTDTITGIYASAFHDAKARSNGGQLRILSIGCGDGAEEIKLAKQLIEEGERNFRIVGADLSPILLRRLADESRRAGLENVVVGIESDLNNVTIDDDFAVIMANHSLHHIVELEKLFDFADAHLQSGGVFATCDMIGRNGHQRWPEAAAVVKSLWPTLTERRRYHAQLRRLDDIFRDHDSSAVGFEGIRAQDILPLLLDHFQPARFVGVGGFIELMVDRGYGHGYDPNDPADVAFIHFLAEVNDILLDAGVIRPTIMLAHFVKESVPEKFYRTRSAWASVRNGDPNWLRFHQ